MTLSLEAAFPSAQDLTSYSRLLSDVYDAEFSSKRAPAHPRDVIADSWARLRRRGVRPSRAPASAKHAEATSAGAPATSDLDSDALLLTSLIRANLGHLSTLLRDDTAVLVVSNRHGRIVARSGGTQMLSRADDLGFVEGAAWGENSVGTNAIGTALAARRQVQVHGAEHYSRSQHLWSCTAAPVRDPRNGRTLGTVDLSFEVADAHPMSLGLISLLARAAAQDLRERHHRDITELRAASFSATRELDHPWAVVDEWGWVAASYGVDVSSRIPLPRGLKSGDTWTTPSGEVLVTGLERGFLLSPARASRRPADAPPETTITLSAIGTGALVELRTPTGSREVRIPSRQADILFLLAASPRGLTAPELSARLYGTSEHDVTVRAEISRLRRHLGDVLVAAPYRFAPGIAVTATDN
ncbi:helix-turn-helix domain-containing protein [Pseudoclavibacter sp. AY1H1]|uniref:helix-turn-helix domain-containing protein n=1 Tax=Pseudoclavibacter sp. AY1H1 TaxID=2080584 RepID=UPI0015E3FF7D|nr:helix-turn-helix domain-containing protein [Pseudoclavibacter sp. AY1H1]